MTGPEPYLSRRNQVPYVHMPTPSSPPAVEKRQRPNALAEMQWLQRSAGNVAVGRLLHNPLGLQRDKQSASHASGPTDAAGFQGMITDRIIAINNAYQAIFERQASAIEDLAADLRKADDATITEGLLQAAVEAALSKALVAVAEKIIVGIGKASAKVIAERAISGYSGEVPPGLTAADLIEADVVGPKARAISLAAMAQKWVSGKIEKGVPSALKSMSSNLSAVDKFIQGQRGTLQNSKEEAQDQLTDILAPGLRLGDQQQSLLTAGALLHAVRDARTETHPLQYLRSVAEWGEAIRGQGHDDPTANFTGVLRIRIGSELSNAPSIEEARMSGMKENVLQRIKSTPSLAERPLSELPCQKVIVGPVFVYRRANQPIDTNSVRYGGQWLVTWAQRKHGLATGPLLNMQMVAASLLVADLDRLRIGDLGEIRHGSGAGLFSD